MVGYLGPTGTFTEQALLSQTDLADIDRLMFNRIPQVLTAVEAGEVDYGFVAIENAIEGAVTITVDTLAFDLDVLIQREVDMPISMNLMAPAGTALADIERIITIPVASAQCRIFLSERMPKVDIEAWHSTAGAAEHVAELNDGRSAAIGPARSAEVYGLDIIAAGIEDHPENHTRFVLVGRDGVPASTGHDKTSIVVYQKANEPGSLMSILQEFSARGINLGKLESRPTKTQLGDYCFLIDLEGHISDDVVGDCLRNLHQKQGGVKFLGSYPAAGSNGGEIRRDVAASQDASAAWLTDLRAKIR